MCVYDKHPLASQDTIPSNQELVEYQATKSWSEYTTTQRARAGWNIQPMTQLGKVNIYNKGLLTYQVLNIIGKMAGGWHKLDFNNWSNTDFHN